MEQIDEDITAYLEQVVEEEHQADHEGPMGSCMESLGRTDSEVFGVCAVSTNGQVKSAANAEEKFPLESTSKALSLALALEDNGPEALFRHIGKEPKGDRFHSVAALEEGELGVPSNPMINAGAVAVTAAINGADGEERYNRLQGFVRTLANNPDIDFNQMMFETESRDHHRALFYYMRDHGVVSGTEEDSLLPYIKQTSIEMNCLDLARIASVFANGGRLPGTDRQIISPETVRVVLTLMFTTGMYDASGAFAVDVGIPAKSGVSGAIMAVVPGRMGFGCFGPALDSSGSSIAGVRMLRKLSTRWRLGVFS